MPITGRCFTESLRPVLALQPTELTTDVLVAAECGANRGDELVASGIFQDVSERSGRQPASTSIDSECTVTSTMRAFGLWRRISRTASMPSTPGMAMSVTITSGESRLRPLHQSVTILDRRNDLEFCSEQLAQLFRSLRVILGEQDSWAPQGGLANMTPRILDSVASRRGEENYLRR